VRLRLRRGAPSFRHEGYLLKRGHRSGGMADARLLPGWAVHWKRRYVVLAGRLLHWFPTREDYLRARAHVGGGAGGAGAGGGGKGGKGGGYEAYGGVTLSLKGYEVLVIARRDGSKKKAGGGGGGGGDEDGSDGDGDGDGEPDWEFLLAPLDRRASKRRRLQQQQGGGGGFFSKLFGGGGARKGALGKRDVKVRHFRAASEGEMHAWVKALAASSIISQS